LKNRERREVHFIRKWPEAKGLSKASPFSRHARNRGNNPQAVLSHDADRAAFLEALPTTPSFKPEKNLAGHGFSLHESLPDVLLIQKRDVPIAG
jgi:hypothetical protein